MTCGPGSVPFVANGSLQPLGRAIGASLHDAERTARAVGEQAIAVALAQRDGLLGGGFHSFVVTLRVVNPTEEVLIACHEQIFAEVAERRQK